MATNLNQNDAAKKKLDYMYDYVKAKTDEQRGLALYGMEQENAARDTLNQMYDHVMTQTGGGTSGPAKTTLGNMYDHVMAQTGAQSQPQDTASSFTDLTRPTYNNQWADKIQDAYDKVTSFGDFSYDIPAPEFTDRYADDRADLLAQLKNPGEFSYDYNTDPVYGAYAKQYRREGDRAAANALAQTSAATGGMPSSYAVNAAAQAGNYYGAQLADKIPQLYSEAYDRWLDQFTLKQHALSALQGESQNDYDRYLGELNQYNTDRNLAYQKYRDEYSRLIDAMNAASTREQIDYAKYLDELGQYNTDRDFAYNQRMDELEAQLNRDQTAYDRAWQAAEIGDYSQLNALGIDTTYAQEQLALQRELDRLNAAGAYAQYGDLSKLEGAGVDIGQLLAEREYNRIMQDTDAKRAELGLAGDYAQYGDYSKLKEYGVDIATLLAQQEQARREAALDEEYRQAQIDNIKWTQEYNKQQDAYNKQQDAYDRQYKLALAAYEAGDPTLLRAMGVNPETVKSAGEVTQAQAMAALNAVQNGKADVDDYDALIRAGYYDQNGAPTDKLTAYGMTDAEAAALAKKADKEYLTEEEWNQLKAYGADADAVMYDTYELYSDAYRKYKNRTFNGAQR